MLQSTRRSGLIAALLALGATLIVPVAGSLRAEAATCTHRFVPADAPRIPTIVREARPGRVFCFARGTYDMTDVIRPRDGDRFIGSGAGSRGTILRGARTITN